MMALAYLGVGSGYSAVWEREGRKEGGEKG